MLWLVITTIVIIVATFLYIKKRKKINRQNLINEYLDLSGHKKKEETSFGIILMEDKDTRCRKKRDVHLRK